VGSLFFVLIQYLLAKAAGVSSGLLPAKELELPDVEKNFFDPNYYAQRSIGLIKKLFEAFFGTTARSIFFRSSAFLLLAALTCLAMLLVKYVGATELFELARNGFAIQLQPEEYDNFRSAFGSTFDRMLTPDRFAHVGYFIFVTASFFIFAYAILSACTAIVIVGLYRFLG
jgi:hypothetical protein